VRGNRGILWLVLGQRIAVVAVLALLVSPVFADAAWSSTARGPNPIYGYSVIGPHRLAIEVGCSPDQPSVQVTETKRAVRIEAVYTQSALLCARLVSVSLRTPLHHRSVIDVTTKQQVKPTEPPDTASDLSPTGS
jgi:hypothetical protein